MSKVSSRKGKARALRSKLVECTRNLESIQNLPIDHRTVSIIFMDGLKNHSGQPEDAFVSNDLIQISRGLPLLRTCELVAWGMCILWTRNIKWNIGEDYDKPASSRFFVGVDSHDIYLQYRDGEPERRRRNELEEHIFGCKCPAETTIRQVAEAVSWEWHHWRNEMASDALRYLAMSEDDRLASLTKSGLKMMYAAFAQARHERQTEQKPLSAAAA